MFYQFLDIMKKQLFLIVIFAFYAVSCTESDEFLSFPDGEVEGFKPIYGEPSEIKEIEMQPARSLQNPGKIFRKDGYLYINEFSTGVHIIDNRDPSNPNPVAFINIPGNVDIAAQGDVFYFNNYNDLVAVRITNNQQIEVLKRLEDVFPTANLAPNRTGVYFECVDETKGVVVGWERATLINPKCFRQ